MQNTVLLGKKFNLIKWGTLTYFHLTHPWLLAIMYKSSGEKIVDGNWPQGGNGELRIQISDCWQMDGCYNIN